MKDKVLAIVDCALFGVSIGTVSKLRSKKWSDYCEEHEDDSMPDKVTDYIGFIAENAALGASLGLLLSIGLGSHIKK